MKLITTSSGAVCNAEVVALQRSMRENHWTPELLVASPDSIPDVNTKKADLDELGWRAMKTRFALFFDGDINDDEPVCWVDTDCEAIATEPEWLPLESDSIAGVVLHGFDGGTHFPEKILRRLHAPMGEVLRYTSYFLQFDSFRTAKRLCHEWYSCLVSDYDMAKEDFETPTTDEIALCNAIRKLNLQQVELGRGAQFDSPYGALIHHGSINGHAAFKPNRRLL